MKRLQQINRNSRLTAEQKLVVVRFWFLNFRLSLYELRLISNVARSYSDTTHCTFYELLKLSKQGLENWDIYDKETTESQGEVIIAKLITGQHKFRLNFNGAFGFYENIKKYYNLC